jgi:hypothetical protein
MSFCQNIGTDDKFATLQGGHKAPTEPLIFIIHWNRKSVAFWNS